MSKLVRQYKCWSCGKVVRNSRDIYPVICFHSFGIGEFFDIARVSIIEWRDYKRKEKLGEIPKLDIQQGKFVIKRDINTAKRRRFLFWICEDCVLKLYRKSCYKCPFNWKRGDPTNLTDRKNMIVKIKESSTVKHITDYRYVEEPHLMGPVRRPVKVTIPIKIVRPGVEIKVCYGYANTLYEKGYI